MRPSISELKSWQLSDLTNAQTLASAHAKTIAEATTAVDRGLLATSGWKGSTQRAAKRAITTDSDHAAEVCAVLLSLASTAANAHRELQPARAQVLAEVQRATDDGFTVADTGQVTVPDDPDADEDEMADRNSSAQIWENRIDLALTAVATLDDTYGRAFAVHAKDLATMEDGQAPITLPDGTRVDPDAVVTRLAAMSPAARRAFLATLSADDLRQLVIANPQVMGNLDGVPFATRIAANDVNIRTALAAEIAAGRGGGQRAAKLAEMLTPVADTNGRAGTPASVPRKFIAFSNTDVGNTIEMVGNLDTATPNATVYVPGTGTNLNGSKSNYEAARNLSKRTGGPVFLYLDERLPQTLGEKNIDGAKALLPVNTGAAVMHLALGLKDSAADAGPAKDIAPGLVSFGRELDTELAHVAPTAKTTFIGHSYGGVVVGTAEQLGLRADRVVYASSAGTGALSTGWHNANPNVERYSITAPGDPIQSVQASGRFGGDPDTAAGVTRLDTGSYGSSTADCQLVAGIHSHGGYWDDPDSTAFTNMVSVITGDTPTEYVRRLPDTPEPQQAVLDGAPARAMIAGSPATIPLEMLRRWLSSD
ncbi:hypothetical protein HH308_10510 [Gordonia sp. TBRC 11910]|uniref:DUF1023 domain-containing protein n=1 Tax=Gordonia asplenii TaxID=2725283 RepID=A0A848KRQ4_9ACTN|nr:alpha/beta hydrolase [Gordonia asplenii]NMO01644.1 hypothetical protein [Gordonia asplenii]